MNDFWSQYWRRGHLTSFGEKYSGNYQGALKSVWIPFFESLNSDDILLDVCTGNGALVFLARELKGINNGPKVVGIDFAELPNTQLEKAEKNAIELRANVYAEELPFEDNSISHLVSQYGLEYTDLQKSLAEIGRVLKSGGKFKFVCHYYDSTILKENLNILNCCRSLSAKGSVLDLVTQLVTELEKLNAGNAGPMRGSANSEIIRNQLNEGMGQHLQKFGESLHDTNFPILVQSLFNPQNRHLNKSEMIKSYVDDLEGVVSRLADLDKAALSREKMQLLEQQCQANGLNIDIAEPLSQQGTGNIAWVFTGSRV